MSKKQTTVRLPEKTLSELHRRYPIFENDSELIRFALNFLVITGGKTNVENQ